MGTRLVGHLGRLCLIAIPLLLTVPSFETAAKLRIRIGRAKQRSLPQELGKNPTLLEVQAVSLIHPEITDFRVTRDPSDQVCPLYNCFGHVLGKKKIVDPFVPNKAYLDHILGSLGYVSSEENGAGSSHTIHPQRPPIVAYEKEGLVEHVARGIPGYGGIVESKLGLIRLRIIHFEDELHAFGDKRYRFVYDPSAVVPSSLGEIRARVADAIKLYQVRKNEEFPVLVAYGAGNLGQEMRALVLDLLAKRGNQYVPTQAELDLLFDRTVWRHARARYGDYVRALFRSNPYIARELVTTIPTGSIDESQRKFLEELVERSRKAMMMGASFYDTDAMRAFQSIENLGGAVEAVLKVKYPSPPYSVRSGLYRRWCTSANSPRT